MSPLPNAHALGYMYWKKKKKLCQSDCDTCLSSAAETFELCPQIF